MVITYNGDGYFKFQSGSTTVLLDPTNQRSFKGADIVLNTQRPAETDAPEPSDKSAPFWIDHPGEYEVGGIRIRGWQVPGSTEQERTVFRMDYDEFRFVCFGRLTKEPSADIIEYLEHVDIVVIPAGGTPCITPAKAAAFIRQFEPAIVIPSHYETKKALSTFLKEFNQSSCDMEERVTLRKSDVKEGTMAIRCLKS